MTLTSLGVMPPFPPHYNLTCPYAWQSKGNWQLEPRALRTVLTAVGITAKPKAAQERWQCVTEPNSLLAQLPARTTQVKYCCSFPLSPDSWSLAAQSVDFLQMLLGKQPSYCHSNAVFPEVLTLPIFVHTWTGIGGCLPFIYLSMLFYR